MPRDTLLTVLAEIFRNEFFWQVQPVVIPNFLMTTTRNSFVWFS
jgi:hypothetical protein